VGGAAPALHPVTTKAMSSLRVTRRAMPSPLLANATAYIDDQQANGVPRRFREK